MAPNRLSREKSPYLLQHAENPVDWYPWCGEAFERARREDKPVFLSIGYSTCHWCHVMAHESFEDEEIARLLNSHFIAVKVDREERPDIDSIYMTVCQAFTGSGGWPTSIFMTPEQKPFFAGTYFPKRGRGGMPGLYELLSAIARQWETDRGELLRSAEELLAQLHEAVPQGMEPADEQLLDRAAELYKRLYDRRNGGFGRAPKFPSPHNLIFLLRFAERRGDAACHEMAEHTLLQMYRGGLFDHIGGGFCRYSTDSRFLIPHFEKMLYDNALLIQACCEAHAASGRQLYLEIAERTAAYVLREMTAPEGGFYSAQDADSGQGEGRYYLFTHSELLELLGKTDGEAFCQRFGIHPGGNFEGRSVPNLLESEPEDRDLDRLLPKVYAYRRQRCALQLDDKILTSSNAFMISALCRLGRESGRADYLQAARRAEQFLRRRLCEGDQLFVSYRGGRRGERGFLDDYAGYIQALLELYAATLEQEYLDRAKCFCRRTAAEFADYAQGGFYLCGPEHEQLILRPKESYDGAVPSGNSLMAWNLVRLHQLTGREEYGAAAQRQLEWLAAQAAHYPAGYAMFLTALLDMLEPPRKIVAVLRRAEERSRLSTPPDAVLTVLDGPTAEYPLKNDKTTFYVCRGHTCLPPTNDAPR